MGDLTQVSVPLRGKGRDQLGSGVRTPNHLTSPFPSPCGEKVGINLSAYLGEAYNLCAVSVPLRGKGRDQSVALVLSKNLSDLDVSVPLRGKGRDQYGYVHR